MPDALAVLLSVALPWIAGAGILHAFTRRTPHGGLLAVGYGYLAGALLVTLLLRALSFAGVAWTLPLAATPVAVLAALAVWLQRGWRWREARERAVASIAALSPFARAVFWIALVLVIVRVAGLALEVAWRPVQPWDVWSHWATKAKVWFEYKRIVPFVPGAEWLVKAPPLAFTDQQPTYPGTVPLLQVWTDLWLGAWNDALMNAPWPVLFVSFGCAVYAQARRAGARAVEAMVFTYLLMSLPFFDVHVALAGLADIFVAIAFALTVMAMAHAVRTRERLDVALAALMAVACAASKVEGSLWLATLVPGIVVALSRRLGLRLVGFVIAAAMLYLAFGPTKLRLFGYSLQTEFTNVSLPLFQHLFVMDNWHLFWYTLPVLVFLRRRALLAGTLAPMSIAMLGALGFIVAVFFFSNAAGGVDDETLVNRLLLHAVPSLAFYLLLLVQSREPARVTASDTLPTAAVARLPG